jgi:hypothetical protein
MGYWVIRKGGLKYKLAHFLSTVPTYTLVPDTIIGNIHRISYQVQWTKVTQGMSNEVSSAAKFGQFAVTMGRRALEAI